MPGTFYLDIVVPDRKFFSGDVQEIIVKTPGGEIGILKGHMPMVVAISIGSIKIKKDDVWTEAFLSEGFLEVMQDKATILADTAEWPEEIDINRAKAAEERARERLHSKLGNVEHMSSQAALQRAISRLKVSGKRS
jgi:F-type H+-transporting ATPase subunit epsilon